MAFLHRLCLGLCFLGKELKQAFKGLCFGESGSVWASDRGHILPSPDLVSILLGQGCKPQRPGSRPEGPQGAPGHSGATSPHLSGSAS